MFAEMIGLDQGYIQTPWHLTVFPVVILAPTLLTRFFVVPGLRGAFDPSIHVE